ncbi:MAG: hypothetical protein ACLS9K_07505 [Lachnospira eligens]
MWKQLPSWWYIRLGVLGVWFGMFIDWGFRSLAFLIRFIRGKWAEGGYMMIII